MLPAGFSWTGAYVGVQGGYQWGDADQLFTGGDNSNPDVDGFLGGVYVGFNYQLPNNIVVGVDADIAWNGADGQSLFFNPAGVAFPANFVSDFDANWSAAGRIKLGYALDRWLPYISGGVAALDGDYTYFNGAVVNAVGNDTYVGWTIGAGVEYAFTDNLIFRGEYRYNDFGSADFPSQNGFDAFSVDVKSHDVRIGLSYKF